MHVVRRLPRGITALAWIALASALIASASAIAAVTTATHTTYQVRRGSANVAPAPTTEEECIRRAHEGAAKEGETRESGASDHQCHRVLHVLAIFRPNPPLPPVACGVSAWSDWSAGSWSACLAGQRARTETRSRTVTTPASNGGAACPALTETRVAVEACTTPGAAVLIWTPPTLNSDGSAVTNLAGYRIHYGRSAGELTAAIDLDNPSLRTYTFNGLAVGTWFFAVSSLMPAGQASFTHSGVVSKAIR
jgi:hypothetical protein